MAEHSKPTRRPAVSGPRFVRQPRAPNPKAHQAASRLEARSIPVERGIADHALPAKTHRSASKSTANSTRPSRKPADLIQEPLRPNAIRFSSGAAARLWNLAFSFRMTD